jgi:glycosyltransferase involved in cell wall biosynthesis
MGQIQVSVNIPVYNASSYVRQAVESALNQPQTAEVVIVEDFSTDNSWDVCQQLAAEDNRIQLYRPDDGRNHGCSASRNLAIQKSSCEYIAFLDADDFYLPDRFSTAQKMFQSDPELDGVYEAIAMYVENDDSLRRWKDAGRACNRLHTMTKRVDSNELFSALVHGGVGSFSTDGFIVKRTILGKIGYFDQDLPLHMDDVFFIKAAAKAKLLPGYLDEPVAMWRVHDQNRISAPRSKSLSYKMKLRFWYSLWKWSITHLSADQQKMLLVALLNDARYKSRFQRPFPGCLYGIQQRLQLGLLPFSYPAVLAESAFWNSFSLHPASWLRSKR